jgi:hypothetical protein
MNQPELPLLFIMHPPKGMPEPKTEPHRVELDNACAAAMLAVRSAIEAPSAANLRTLTDAVIKAHQSLLTLNFVETDLSHEQRA